MPGKSVRIVLSPEARLAWEALGRRSGSKPERSIFAAITRKVELIRLNPHYGEPIAKRLIPREYVAKYGITNLFRVELPHFWRMLYTLTAGEMKIEIIAFVLGISDHREYDREFGYRKG